MRQLTLALGWLAAGCAPSLTASQHYAAALAAPDFDAGLPHCDALPDAAARAECAVALTERWSRPIDDCARIADDRWAQECRFLYAERAARAGDLDAAFAACDGTPTFGRECSYHLIRQAAQAVADRAPADVVGLAAPYTRLARAPDAERLFWKAWVRERLAHGTRIDPSGCPVSACEEASFDELRVHLPGVRRSRPDFCTADVHTLGGSVWVPGPLTDAWVTSWRVGPCHAPPPVGPPISDPGK